MKKLFILFCFLLTTGLAYTQDRLTTVDDLKYFIGYRTSEIQKVAKKKGYKAYAKEDDEKEGPFVVKLFMGEERDLIIYCKDNDVVAAGTEDITEAEYKTLLSWLKSNGFTKTVSGRGGTEKSDLWVSHDKRWKVSIKYPAFTPEKPFEFLLARGEMQWESE